MPGQRRRRLLLPFLAAIAIGLTACGPEGSRERGGGAGADVRNWDRDEIELHGNDNEVERIYYQTPNKPGPGER